MDAKDFQKDLLEEVKATAATEGEGSSAAFTAIVSEYLINSEVLTDFTPAFYVGTGKNNRKIRVDGYTFDEFDCTFNLVIADYIDNQERDVLTKTQASQLFDRLLYFIDEAYGPRLYKEVEVSTPAADMIEMLRFNMERIRKYRLLLFTDGFMSDRITTIDAKNFNNIQVECQIWDIDRLYRVCCSDIGRQNIEIDFKAYTEKGIPCLAASSSVGLDYKSYLGIIPGLTLADIYDAYGSQLLEGNVRSFLSTKVAVNKKIRETILRLPEKFFAYNNGISATAMDLVIEKCDGNSYITYAKDFQIINGGQTTASLSNARHKDKADLSHIYVQMKLTEVDSDSDKASDLIRNISRSSNSQNKVSDADFFSTHPFHIRMEQISRRMYAPAVGGAQYETKWFYERARGQYLQAQMHMTKSSKDKFVVQNPKRQVITKTDLAKIRNTWEGLPHIVSKGAQTNFMKFAEDIDDTWSVSDQVFNEKYFKESVALSILFKHTEQLINRQEWYEHGYRANIVTYSLALLRRLIKIQFKDFELDLMQIWNRQTVPEEVSVALIEITKHVFEIITSPDRETINVTQWCKRENCWNKFKHCDIFLKGDWEKVLININDERSEHRAAKKDQRIASDAEIQTKVLELGTDYWKRLNDFTLGKHLQTVDDATALRYSMQIPEKFPSIHQCKKLLALITRAEAEGFK